jgi:antitoxin component of RelBE/YafQ-DinJ toxin-antitoxin module
MTVLFRCRVEKPLLDRANEVTKKLGTSTPEMFRIFVAHIARTGQVPVVLQGDTEDSLADSWAQRAALIESFYGDSKTW